MEIPKNETGGRLVDSKKRPDERWNAGSLIAGVSIIDVVIFGSLEMKWTERGLWGRLM